MRVRNTCLAALGCALGLVGIASAEDQAVQPFRLTAEYDRPGLPVPHWSFHVEGSGESDYQRTYATPAVGASDAPIHFTMSANGMHRLQKLLTDSRQMQPCETKTKGLARMGQKSLEFQTGGGPAARCSFNYTDNKPLAAAADYLIAVSNTLEEGATIDRLHRFDRLGLDPVLIRLSASAKDGKAPELLAIKPALQALVADDKVLERVRMKATQLLALAEQQ